MIFRAPLCLSEVDPISAHDPQSTFCFALHLSAFAVAIGVKRTLQFNVAVVCDPFHTLDSCSVVKLQLCTSGTYVH